MLQIDLNPSFLNRDKIVSKGAPSKGTLNRGKRIKELKEISRENKQILQRINKSKASIDFKKLN